MGDAIISRRGGSPSFQTLVPSINFVSKDGFKIVVTFTNNDSEEVEVYYEFTSPLTDTVTDTVTLAAAATSSNITFTELTQETQFTISAYALVTNPKSKKIKSEIVTTSITTDTVLFTAATGGTTLEYDVGFKRFRSHTFTSNGNFVVSSVGDDEDNRNKVDYLIIAGGGPGGAGFSGGGGGAGGYRTTITPVPSDESPDAKVVVTVGTFPVTIGAGGSSESGSNSLIGFNTSVISTGGGIPGGTGGSGGGGANSPGGNGITGQGRNGGSGAAGGGGGGGGAGAVGSNGSGTNHAIYAFGGKGGNGLDNLLRTGSNETRAGGGGGSPSTGSSVGLGGTGGGGAGGTNSGVMPGQVNTGGGGGSGVGTLVDRQGGSGIVVIRYEIEPI